MHCNDAVPYSHWVTCRDLNMNPTTDLSIQNEPLLYRPLIVSVILNWDSDGSASYMECTLGAGMDAEVIIVGAGAAGLWAAATAAKLGASVLLLEKTGRAGTKVLASGGTRCNLTTTLDPQRAGTLYGDAAHFLAPALRALPPVAVVQHFHDLGVNTTTEPALEKVFPASQKAMDVRNALLNDALKAGVDIRYRCPVTDIGFEGEVWTAHTRSGSFTCRKLLLCPGGQSYPKMGTTGDGYSWLRSLGLRVIPPVPALVPLKSAEHWVTDLTGVSIQTVQARLLDPKGRVVSKRSRPVVFTHRGLSGPGAMDLSVHLARAHHDGNAQGWHVALDLLPQVSMDALRHQLAEAARAPGAPRLVRVIGPGVPSRLLQAVTRQAGLEESNPALNVVNKKRRNKLVDALKGLLVPVHGTLSWNKAEVTGGGLDLTLVNRRTMEVRSLPGLYVFGELLDFTGPIGGLNFQAAFATANLAARHAATRSSVVER